jgi:hypothetical protein
MIQIVAASVLISTFSACIPRLGNTPELIDKVNSHLVAAASQTIITAWAAVNLMYPEYTESLHYTVVGYYVYDMIYLLVSPYATSKALFIAHHMGAMFVALYAIFFQLSYVYILNLLYIVLESGSLLLNLTNVAKILQPYTPFSRNMIRLNLGYYGISRMILFPACLLQGVSIVYNAEHPMQELTYMAPPFFILIILFVVSVNWFATMVQNYIKTQASPDQESIAQVS